MKISILADVCPACKHIHRNNIGIWDNDKGHAVLLCSHPNGEGLEMTVCGCTVTKDMLDYYGVNE